MLVTGNSFEPRGRAGCVPRLDPHHIAGGSRQFHKGTSSFCAAIRGKELTLTHSVSAAV